MEILYHAMSYHEVEAWILIFHKVLGGSLGDLRLNKGIEILNHNYYVAEISIVFSVNVKDYKLLILCLLRIDELELHYFFLKIREMLGISLMYSHDASYGRTKPIILKSCTDAA